MSNWVTVKPQVPAFIPPLAEAVNSLLEALLTILSVVKGVLSVIKAFLIAFTDPLQALIDAIINEIESLLNDIRQIGLYISGDLRIEYPFDNLLGGYSAYERRMIARLVDRTDPTRPDFSDRSAVLAIFLYVSVDTTEIVALISLIDRILALLGLVGPNKVRSYTVPVGLEVAYGVENTGLGTFGLLDEVLAEGLSPSVANLQWKMAPPANSSTIAWPLPSAPGFLVEVSTVPDGLILAYSTPSPNATPDENAFQSRTYGVVLDPNGRPFHLYGGVDMLDFSSLEWSGTNTFTPPDMANGDPKNGKTSVYAYKSSADNVGIPLNALKTSDGKHVLQKTFYVDVKTFLGASLLAPGQPFSALLNHMAMPHDATFEDAGDGKVTLVVSDEPARVVYVRVSSVTSTFQGSGLDPYAFKWSITEGLVTSGVKLGQVRLGLIPGANQAMRSDPSAPITLTFPGTSTKEYLELVTVSLAIMVLARADLLPFLSLLQDAASGTLDESSLDYPARLMDVGAVETKMEDIARYLFPLTIGDRNARKFFGEDIDPVTFRKRLLRRCRAAANEIFKRTGPLPTSVEEFVIEQGTITIGGSTKSLAKVTWADLDSTFSTDFLGLGVESTILNSLDTEKDDGSDPNQGVAGNCGFSEQAREGLKANLPTLSREPGFFPPGTFEGEEVEGEEVSNAPGMGSADDSPVIYTSVSGTIASMKFCRNVFLANPDVLTAANTVLGLATAPLAYSRKPGEGAWTTIRLFPQGIPPLDQFFGEMIAFLRTLQAGIDGVVALILSYINFLEARILELEALIRRIQALLNVILSIDVPAAAGLVVATNGTSGVLQELVTAENKPFDSAAATSYVTAGGKTIQSGTYGAGVVILAGGLPSFAIEILQLLFPEE